MVSPLRVVNVAGLRSSDLVPVELDYDTTTYAVTVSPSMVTKGDTICFNCPKGKVRVVFVSPFDDDGPGLQDSEQRTITVGGFYHFRCFFTPDGYTKEIASPTGGILDVQPHRP